MPHSTPSPFALADVLADVLADPARATWRAGLWSCLVAAPMAGAQPAAPEPAPPPLTPAPTVAPLPSGDVGKALPIILRADEIRGRPDLETVAAGNAEFRRGGTVIRADELRYENALDLARARGNVRISRDGNVFSGPELQLYVQRFEGWFLNPSYHFARTGAGGTAERFDFIDSQRSQALGATYTSCPADGSGGPDWLLSTTRVRLDFEANEGIAEGAVLRFMGVPILGAPVLSFPLTDARKSGWLPPSVNLDNKSGVEFSVPYYWNIAPQRDATFTPAILTRRGVALDSEFRWLEPRHAGQASLHLLPDDRVAGRTRHALRLRGEADAPGATHLRLRASRVSDDEYWKDFPRVLDSITPRLLTQELAGQREFRRTWGGGDPAGATLTLYGRVQHWQVLDDADPSARFDSPYQRSPQLGTRYTARLGGGLELGLEGEVNRFTLPSGERTPGRLEGVRLHALGSVARPWTAPFGWLTPRLSFNAASYDVDGTLPDGRGRASRVIPTLSVDGGLVLERDSAWFGRAMRQTLEPRVLYVNTPFRDQSALPNFDAAAKDFNFETIYTDNAFSGVDRVSDAHQLTAGVTSRLLDPASGAEAARVGIVQRYLFRDQRITPEGVPFTQRFSDVLLLGSTKLASRWQLDASLQYSPDIGRTTRSILGARYSPGPYRTIGATYRLARGLSEQVEFAWQWPVAGTVRVPGEPARASPFAQAFDGAGGGGCKGAWYSVGRLNYSTRDKRVTDSVIGLEYDAGCWIGRVVAERLSTGRSEATTRLLLQLELVGLSRLGSNPLQVLKDNIPGYRLLREEDPKPSAPPIHD